MPDSMPPWGNWQKATVLTPAERKERPMYLGLMVYFPDALEAVSHVSHIGSRQHHPGEPVHWDKPKSADHGDALLRHIRDHASGNPVDTDGVPHLAKVAWRALAWLQTEMENANR